MEEKYPDIRPKERLEVRRQRLEMRGYIKIIKTMVSSFHETTDP